MAQGRTELLQEALPKLLRRGSLDGASRLVANAYPADLANLFRKLTDSQRATLFSLITETPRRADVLCELDKDIAVDFLPLVEDDVLIELLAEMSGDDAADMVELVSDDTRRDKILARLTQAHEEDVTELYHYDPETAAGIMTSNVFALGEDTTVKEAIETIQRQGDEFEIVYYLFVINKADALVGVLSLRQLVLSPPETALHDVMETDVVRVGMSTDQEEVARIVARYNLLAVPVVDASNTLMGVITVDDIIDVIRSEATEDMLKMAGAGQIDPNDSAVSSAKARLPWLLASFGGGVIAALLIGGFEETIAKVAPLAAFIPIVLGMGGNVGIQSATIVTRGLALGQVDTSSLGKVVVKEFFVALICGVTYGLLLGGLAFGRYHGTDLVSSGLVFGLTVGLAVAAAMVMAAVVGAAIPIVFARLNADPALASGPFVTTTVDVLGIAVYFAMAMALLGI